MTRRGTVVRTDDELRSDVLAELARYPRIRHSQIAVIVKDGAVTLNGMVPTLDEKICAERAVKHIRDVRAIANDIEVKLPEQMRKADEGIAEQIGRLLTWYSSLRNMDVKADVDDGRVTLTGEVDFLYQKEIVAERVAELDGVSAVSNQIKIRERRTIDEQEVARQIVAALHRHASIEASRIQVSIADGEVKLEGTVGAYRERDLVVEAVRATAGVRNILDHLKIK
jgi:osmotically-inducible protein OsmY